MMGTSVLLGGLLWLDNSCSHHQGRAVTSLDTSRNITGHSSLSMSSLYDPVELGRWGGCDDVRPRTRVDIISALQTGSMPAGAPHVTVETLLEPLTRAESVAASNEAGAALLRTGILPVEAAALRGQYALVATMLAVAPLSATPPGFALQFHILVSPSLVQLAAFDTRVLEAGDSRVIAELTATAGPASPALLACWLARMTSAAADVARSAKFGAIVQALAADTAGIPFGVLCTGIGALTARSVLEKYTGAAGDQDPADGWTRVQRAVSTASLALALLALDERESTAACLGICSLVHRLDESVTGVRRALLTTRVPVAPAFGAGPKGPPPAPARTCECPCNSVVPAAPQPNAAESSETLLEAALRCHAAGVSGASSILRSIALAAPHVIGSPSELVSLKTALLGAHAMLAVGALDVPAFLRAVDVPARSLRERMTPEDAAAVHAAVTHDGSCRNTLLCILHAMDVNTRYMFGARPSLATLARDILPARC